MKELIEQRSGKIGLMVQKAENLRSESKNYYTKSKKVKSTVKCNKAIIISFITVVVIVFINNISSWCTLRLVSDADLILVNVE